ncbi:MAG: Asp-tRNA(Asn)/Glu-tRNA(Gln) amidotransferase subunit GatC [Tepidiformaceae bacterium]
MSLTRDEVLHIARLARLRLDPDEVDRTATQLSGILDYFTALQAVDTDGVEPTANPLPLRNVMREDAVTPSLPRDEALANAPAVEDGLVRVRAVLE